MREHEWSWKVNSGVVWCGLLLRGLVVCFLREGIHGIEYRLALLVAFVIVRIRDEWEVRDDGGLIRWHSSQHIWFSVVDELALVAGAMHERNVLDFVPP